MAVAILPGVVVLLDAPEWGRGAVEIGMDVIGAAATGMDAIGMAIGVITATITLFLSATSVFPAGGAGAGAVDIPMDITVTGIRTVITGMVTAIRTVMVMATEEDMDTVTTATVTAMDMATALAANTALPLGRE